MNTHDTDKTNQARLKARKEKKLNYRYLVGRGKKTFSVLTFLYLVTKRKIGFWEHFWGLVGVGFCRLAWSCAWWNPRSAGGGIALGGGVQLFSGSGGCFQKSNINFLSLTFGCYPVQINQQQIPNYNIHKQSNCYCI